MNLLSNYVRLNIKLINDGNYITKDSIWMVQWQMDKIKKTVGMMKRNEVTLQSMYSSTLRVLKKLSPDSAI